MKTTLGKRKEAVALLSQKKVAKTSTRPKNGESRGGIGG